MSTTFLWHLHLLMWHVRNISLHIFSFLFVPSSCTETNMCYLPSTQTARRGETLDSIYLTSNFLIQALQEVLYCRKYSRLRWMQHVITSIWCQGRWTTITIYCNHRVWSLRCDGCLDYSKLWKYHCINFYSKASVSFVIAALCNYIIPARHGTPIFFKKFM